MTLIFSTNLSCRNNERSIRIKNWGILFDQSNSIETVIHKNGWKPIASLSRLKLPYSQIRDFQYIWLKGQFWIDKDPSIYHGLSTGRIRYSDKIFINGHLIGSMPPEEVNWNPIPRNYILPKDILKIGYNDIHVQLGTYGNESAGISDDVLIQTKEEFNRDQLANSLIYKRLPFGIIFLYIGLITHCLISFMWNRKERINITFPGLMLCIVIFIFISLPSYKMAGLELYCAIRASAGICFSIFFILGVQATYSIYLSRYNRIIIPALFLFSLLILISSDTSYFWAVIYILGGLSITIITSILVLMIFRLNSINRLSLKNNDKITRFIVVTSSVFLGVVAALEIYFHATAAHYSGMLITFVPPGGLIYFGIIIAREITRKQLELELLYDKLKRIEYNERGPRITDSSEEKLKRVIDFIDENYRSDISREGLAAAVEMSPDYMSKLFKAYTGMKVNEYINKLRVEEAARRLRNDKTRILDIAIAVGFDNIMTFNRSFKSIHKITPSEFRSSVNNQ